MQETKETEYGAGWPVCDAVRFICDASYAVLPEDVAHRLGELKKNLLSGMRWVIEKDIEWIDARIAGGDRLREEWRRGRAQNATDGGAAGSGI